MPKLSTGRVGHQSKITIYMDEAEILAVEEARVRLRRDYGMKADRGRVVRAALALMLSDFDHRGNYSDLYHELNNHNPEGNL